MSNEWKTVYCGYENKPAELDTTSSSTTVYERRNFEEVVTKVPSNSDDAIDEEIKQWKYEERTYSKEQYELINAVAEKIQIKHETEIIDKFTENLMEEGLL